MATRSGEGEGEEGVTRYELLGPGEVSTGDVTYTVTAVWSGGIL